MLTRPRRVVPLDAGAVFVPVRKKVTPLLLEAALSAPERFLDSEFSIQHGVGPCRRGASPRFGCIDKDEPFPTTWICRLNDFKLDGVFHGRSSKGRYRKFVGLPRNECRLHVQPLSINIGSHRRGCSDYGKGHDCKSKSDEIQTLVSAILAHLKPVIAPGQRTHHPRRHPPRRHVVASGRAALSHKGQRGRETASEPN